MYDGGDDTVEANPITGYPLHVSLYIHVCVRVFVSVGRGVPELDAST